MQYFAVDNFFPELDIWTHFVASDYSRFLLMDSLRNSHPIEVPVGPVCECFEIFDSISYSKGASVIRMLHSYIGDDVIFFLFCSALYMFKNIYNLIMVAGEGL